MSFLVSWLFKSRPDEELLEELWNDFDASYIKLVSYPQDDNQSVLKTADFRVPLKKFCKYCHAHVP